jgi:hypothetical protein
MTAAIQAPNRFPGAEVWPDLPLDVWRETYETLHRWMQIVGKIRLALTPVAPHCWQVPLYITARGLTTSPIPYGRQIFQIDFDFIDHKLRIETSQGTGRSFQLLPRSVAAFYSELMGHLHLLGIDVTIWTVPVEMEVRTPFEQDVQPRAYDPEYARRFWEVLVQVDRVLKTFRSRFAGKVSPVHFFWGGFDMAVTRFSGRRAPEHPGAPNVARSVMRDAYSHEVSSCGFWPGVGLGILSFYAYAYPEPAGFPEYPIQPSAAYYNTTLREILLPYDVVRASSTPDETLLAFLQSTYEAAAILGQWDRAALER